MKLVTSVEWLYTPNIQTPLWAGNRKWSTFSENTLNKKLHMNLNCCYMHFNRSVLQLLQSSHTDGRFNPDIVSFVLLNSCILLTYLTSFMDTNKETLWSWDINCFGWLDIAKNWTQKCHLLQYASHLNVVFPLLGRFLCL